MAITYLIQQFATVMILQLAFTVLSANPSCSAQSEFQDPPWKYQLRKPAAGWFQPDFNDRNWREGSGGFGDPLTPGSRVGTDWGTNNIWLRRTIDLTSIPKRPALFMHHDEDAQVYINGQQVLSVTGWVTEYKVFPLNSEAASALKTGKNLIAVHCAQTNGGQFIDVHVIDADSVPRLPAPKRREQPFLSDLITEWGDKVTAENAWQEYPRPAMARPDWTNLNGHWNYTVTPGNQVTPPSEWTGKILVPFCLESRLGGVQKLLHEDQALWYHRTFEAKSSDNHRVLLNFEAVDYECSVIVNGKAVGGHKGGNTPFTVDATEAIVDGSNSLIVRVTDATEAHQLRGKQTLSPRGIWYTQVSGIWQTVWMEIVPDWYIADLQISTDAASGSIKVVPQFGGRNTGNGVVQLLVERQTIGVPVKENTLYADAETRIPNPKFWSPDSPHLYPIKVQLLNENDELIDEVSSYAGIRTVGKAKDADGHWRMTLNGKPIFHWGPLDQGWWPDGLLTPPSDAAMLWDIEFLKSAGFNMIRKHIKVEPRRYYYHCDRLGMLVWQDQVSGQPNPQWTRLNPNPKDAEWADVDHDQFMAEFDEMIDELENHPSIVVWTPFNEAWGQHRTIEVGEWTVKRDPSRLVNIASGGNFWPVGDIVDEHRYPHPGFPFDQPRFADYIMVVGEFGGHGLPTEGHLWDPNRRNWGYGDLPKNTDEYRARYMESIRLLTELRQQGIAAGVYTQTTDVEGEINGLVTYDRKVIKIPAAELKKIHEPLLRQ